MVFKVSSQSAFPGGGVGGGGVHELRNRNLLVSMLNTGHGLVWGKYNQNPHIIRHYFTNASVIYTGKK